MRGGGGGGGGGGGALGQELETGTRVETGNVERILVRDWGHGVRRTGTWS